MEEGSWGVGVFPVWLPSGEGGSISILGNSIQRKDDLESSNVSMEKFWKVMNLLRFF